jgi:hypothetical protein
VREKRAPGVGEDHAAADALEERRAQLPLEEVDAAADRGLGEVQGRGRAGEPAAPDDRHERLHVIELHGPISIADAPDNIYALDT